MDDDTSAAPPDAPPVGFVRRLTRNAWRCDGCGDEIESTHRHDFRACTCGALAVDGGLEYERILFRTEVPRTSLCTYELVACTHWFLDPEWASDDLDVDVCVMCRAPRPAGS